MAPGKVDERGQLIQSGGLDVRMGAEVRLPEGAALFGARGRKRDDEIETPGKSVVEASLAVAREQDNPVVILDALEKIIRLGIRKTIVRIGNICALAEERIRFVEKQNHFGVLGPSQKLG